MLAILTLSNCSSDLEDGGYSSPLGADSQFAGAAPELFAPTAKTVLDSIFFSDKVNYVYYRTARCIAISELLNGSCTFIVDDPKVVWQLSKLPRVVYNYDNTPKYYEFAFYIKGEMIGTVTTYAQKETPGVIAYVFNPPLSYKCSTLDYYIGIYPNRYYGQGGTCLWAGCDDSSASMDELISGTDREIFLQTIQNLPDSDRLEIKEYIQHDNTDVENLNQETIAYWQEIDKIFSGVDSLYYKEEPTPFTNIYGIAYWFDINPDDPKDTDDSLIDEINVIFGNEIGQVDKFILPEYDNKKLQLTSWHAYCGPSALAWVYRGKYETYPINSTTEDGYIPLHGDKTSDTTLENKGYYSYYDCNVYLKGKGLDEAKDLIRQRCKEVNNGLLLDFYEYCSPLWFQKEWTFPLFPGGLKKGLRKATKNEYTVEFTCKPYKWINGNKEPLLIIRCARHYLVGFGTAVTKKKNGKIKDKFILVTDNGNMIYDYNQAPFWKKQNLWNLHYGVKKNK